MILEKGRMSLWLKERCGRRLVKCVSDVYTRRFISRYALLRFSWGLATTRSASLAWGLVVPRENNHAAFGAAEVRQPLAGFMDLGFDAIEAEHMLALAIGKSQFRSLILGYCGAKKKHTRAPISELAPTAPCLRMKTPSVVVS